MCGIAGIVGTNTADLGPIGAMTTALRHRGPDDEGYLLADSRDARAWPFRGPDSIEEITDPALPSTAPEGANLAFGHRRLAIIDLTAGGHGPMASPDGSLWITYNGEVYNYLELRDELRALGHAFRTSSDTEVLLAAYRQWGPGGLNRLNGMWAFALYDVREGTLFCARDRYGVKPFHYFEENGSSAGPFFAFASEIKGLLAHPRVPRRPAESAVHSFLVSGALDEGAQTFFEGIRSLPAGHHLTLDLATRRTRVQAWYTLPDGTPPRSGTGEELAALLQDAIRLRLRSDVPVGTCLSGGLDSSTIVAMTARQLAGSPARRCSFSVVYPDPGLDESAHVDSVVAATGVESVRTTPTAAELVRDLPALIRHQDEPIPSPGAYSQWRVMSLAREAGVTVLLDGQGADEVLAGYHYHYGPYLAEVAATGGSVEALSEARQISAVTGLSLTFLLGLLAYHTVPIPRGIRARAVARASTHGRLRPSFLDPAFARRAGPARGERHLPRPSLVAERRSAITKSSLPALLRFEDRNSMAFGVEARTPFLDYRLVERALAFPARDLIRGGWTKALLRDAASGLVPESVRLRRDKLGFATPEARWLREIVPQVREWLGAGSRVAPLLRASALARAFKAPDEDLARLPGLFRLVSLEWWLRSLEARA